MNKYLLLRDNKQSGPYTCDELQQKGLKAYDLVWLEGRSAAWRYPSEIDELKSFAPIVEEQPFERFYKKSSAASGGVTTSSPANVATQSSNGPGPSAAVVQSGSTAYSVVPSRTGVSGDNTLSGNNGASGAPGKRIIYVTLPAGRPAQAATVSREISVIREVAVQAPSNKNQAYLEEGQLSSIPGLTADPAEDNLSHQYESPARAVEINPRSRGGRRSGKALQLVMVGVCILLLLAAGVFIGISIDKNDLRLAKKQAIPPVVTRQTSVVTQPVSNPVITAAPPADTLSRQTTPTGLDGQHAGPGSVNSESGVKSVAAGRIREKAVPVKAQPATEVNNAAKDSGVATYAVAHREASHRTDMAVEKMDKDLIRNNLANLVSIGASHYTVGTFGGISDLQLTVSNRSVYPLDLVVVEVQYIQANKKVFKTENLYFRGIGAGSALMQQAPKSTRGVKVQYKITLVNSKELGLSYSAL